MFRLHHSTADKKRIPLACDPAVISANGGAEIERLRECVRVAEQRLAEVDAAIKEAKATRGHAGIAMPEARRERAAVLETARAQLAEAERPLLAYAETHDPEAIVVPADAALFTIRPLTAAERVNAVSAAAGKSGGASLTAYAAVALPAAVEKVEQAGVAYSIRAFLDAIDDDAALIGVLAELVNAVRSISGLDGLGKAPSGRRVG